MDRDAIWWGVEGFRDDAFALFTVLFAVALVRARERPGPARAALAGLCAGAACLTRITAFSFLLPALAFLSLGRGLEARARRKAAAVCLAVTLAVAGPYMAACAVTYGDPFYAVNFHTKFYRSRSGLEHEAPMSWASYLRTGFGGAELVATGLQGVTAYPFANKWQGLDWWTPVAETAPGSGGGGGPRACSRARRGGGCCWSSSSRRSCPTRSPGACPAAPSGASRCTPTRSTWWRRPARWPGPRRV